MKEKIDFKEKFYKLNRRNEIEFILVKKRLDLHKDCDSKRIICIEMELFSDGRRGKYYASIDYDYGFEFDCCNHCIQEKNNLESFFENRSFDESIFENNREIEENKSLIKFEEEFFKL